MARSRGFNRRLRATDPQDFILPGYLALCLVLGGASAGGYFGNAVLQLIGLAILVWHGFGSDRRALASLGRPLGLFLLVLVGAVLVSLIPLPSALWRSAGGRGFLVADFATLGQAPPILPLTLDSDRTIWSILSLIPFVAVLVLTLSSNDGAREKALFALLAVAAMSILIGAIQLLGGGGSALYFYEITNVGSAVGFFANSNHLATLFLMTLPFVAALAARARNASAKRGKRRLHLPLVAAFLFVLAGLLLNGSVAGLLLLVPSVFGSALIYMRGVGRPLPVRLALGVIAVLAVAVLFLLLGPFHDLLLDKSLSSGNSAVTRETAARLTTHATRDFLPLGSGLGTFRWIYTRYEDASTTPFEYINHAHDDYLELALELGLVGIGLIITALLWLLVRGRSVWIGRDQKGSIARAGWVALAMLLLHSVVDYPGRTAAIAAIAGLCVGVLQAPQPRRMSDQVDSDEGESEIRLEKGRHLSV